MSIYEHLFDIYILVYFYENVNTKSKKYYLHKQGKPDEMP